MKYGLGFILAGSALTACVHTNANPSGSGVFCQDIRGSAAARSACEQRAVQENGVRQDWREQVRKRQERDAEAAARAAVRRQKKDDN